MIEYIDIVIKLAYIYVFFFLLKNRLYFYEHMKTISIFLEKVRYASNTKIVNGYMVQRRYGYCVRGL